MSRIDTSKEQIVHDGRLYSLSPVKAFEVGKWYVYTETTAQNTGWASMMSAVIDGEPRRCSGLGPWSGPGCGWQAAFDGISGGWGSWKCGFENWREVVGHPIGERPERLDGSDKPAGQHHDMMIIDDIIPPMIGRAELMAASDAMVANLRQYYCEAGLGKASSLAGPSSIEDRARSMLRDL